MTTTDTTFINSPHTAPTTFPKNSFVTPPPVTAPAESAAKPDAPAKSAAPMPAAETDAPSEEVRVVSATGAAKGAKPEAFALVPGGPVLTMARVFSVPQIAALADEQTYSALFNTMSEHIWKFWSAPVCAGTDAPSEPSWDLLVAAAAGMTLISAFVNPGAVVDDRPGVVGADHTPQDSRGMASPSDVPLDELPVRFSALPTGALGQLARHYHAGAAKYAAHNWAAGMQWSLAFSASQRHADAFWAGEDHDPEMGSPHIVAAVWHLFSLIEFHTTHPEFDDRPVRGKAACRVFDADRG